MTQARRLAAILAADVAGYSQLIGADEEGTLNSGILDPGSPAGPPQTIVTSQGGASAEPCRATTVRPPARPTGPTACAIVTPSIAGRTRAAIETTPIVPAASSGSTPR
jgi:hypothetical protein